MYDDGDYYYRPYGGAKSLATAEKFDELQRKIQEDNQISWMMQDCMRNINADPETSNEEKAAEITALAAEFAKAIAKNSTAKKSGLFEKLKSAFAEPMNEAKQGGGLFTVKEINGVRRWTGIYSNATEDRDKETITTKAHQEFADWCEKESRYPELWLWHTKGTRIGVADFVDEHNGFAIASGTIDVDVPPSVIDNLQNSPVPLGMSHGFGYADSDLVDGVYHRYRSFEMSVLPLSAAANELTSFGTEVPETMSDQRKQWLTETMGETNAKAVYDGVDALAGFAKAKGISLKAAMTAIAEGVEGTEGQETPAATPPAAQQAAPTAPAAPATETPAPAGDATVEAVKSLLGDFRAEIGTQFKAINDRLDAAPANTENQITKALRESFAPPIEKVAQKSAILGNGGDVIDASHPDYQAAEKSQKSDPAYAFGPSSALNDLFKPDGMLAGFVPAGTAPAK